MMPAQPALPKDWRHVTDKQARENPMAGGRFWRGSGAPISCLSNRMSGGTRRIVPRVGLCESCRARKEQDAAAGDGQTQQATWSDSDASSSLEAVRDALKRGTAEAQKFCEAVATATTDEEGAELRAQYGCVYN